MKSERKYAAEVLKKHKKEDLITIALKVDLERPKHVYVVGSSIRDIRKEEVTESCIGPHDMIGTNAIHLYVKSPFGKYEITIKKEE